MSSSLVELHYRLISICRGRERRPRCSLFPAFAVLYDAMAQVHELPQRQVVLGVVRAPSADFEIRLAQPIANVIDGGEQRLFCRLKDFRRMATRYDRNADNFLAAVCIAAVVSYWL